MSADAEPVYSRAPNVVWRLGPDRVLVRRVGESGDDAAAELLGEAALVWIALDEPGVFTVLFQRLQESHNGGVAELTIDELLRCGWLCTGGQRNT